MGLLMVDSGTLFPNQKLCCRREAARCFLSVSIPRTQSSVISYFGFMHSLYSVKCCSVLFAVTCEASCHFDHVVALIHLLIHFSTHLCHHPHSRQPSLLHSFTAGSKPTFSTNPPHGRFLLPTGLLTITGLDRTYHAHHFIFSFAFYFFCLFRVVD